MPELPVWYAKEAGVFAQHGLDVDLQLAESGAGVPALLSGEVQMVDIAKPQILSAAAGGAQVVDVAENSPLYPFIMQTAPDIKTIEMLKGKKFGISSAGSASDIAARVALRKVGIEPDRDITLVAVGSAANRTAAMESGAIQGAMVIPPDTLLLQDKGFNSLFDLASLKLPNGQAAQVTTRAFIQSNRATVQSWVDSIVDATAQLRKDKTKAVAVLKKYFKSEDDRAMGVAYDYAVSQLFPVYPYSTIEQYADSIELLGPKNEQIKNVDLSKVVDQSFVKSAEERKVGQ